MNVTTLTDISNAAWRRAVGGTAHAQLGHAAEWRAIINRAYGHAPLYLAATAGDDPVGVLPAFVVRRPLFGTVVTSMPFLDSGGPCSTSPAVDTLLVEHLIEEGRRRGARLVELRCVNRLAIDAEPLESKVNMTLALGDPDGLWRRFDKGVRNQIRKAERSGLTVEYGGYGNQFLQQVLEAFGPRARVGLVKKDGATVGGLVALTFKDRMVVPWAACLKEYFSLCPNMLLYWETIRSACADGLARFDFGRSP